MTDDSAPKWDALGYLFYVGDRTKTDLPYESPAAGDDGWMRLRHEEALTPDAIVRLADAAHARYGFRDFKLKGGVLTGAAEMEAVRRSPSGFRRPASPSTQTAHGPEGRYLTLRLAASQAGLCRRSVRHRGRLFGARGDGGISARDRRADRDQHGRNGLARARARARVRAVDIPLADPHFWTMEGSVRVSQCDLGVGAHVGLALERSLRRLAGDACPRRGGGAWENHGGGHALDLQDGQRLTTSPLRIRGGRIAVPDAPGLGVELDPTKVDEAHALYSRAGVGARDDRAAMQYLIPGWTFDPKRPTLVR